MYKRQSYTCRIPTPPLGFPVNPFKANDRVFVEGIVGVGTTGTVNPNTESGFNSSDYGFKLLKVSKYDENVVDGQDEVTIDLSEFSTESNPVKTGIAQTVPTTFANLINASDYPTFFLTQEQSDFEKGDVMNNIKFFYETISKERPSGVKGDFVKKVSISSTMGPGININLDSFRA